VYTVQPGHKKLNEAPERISTLSALSAFQPFFVFQISKLILLLLCTLPGQQQKTE